MAVVLRIVLRLLLESRQEMTVVRAVAVEVVRGELGNGGYFVCFVFSFFNGGYFEDRLKRISWWI